MRIAVEGCGHGTLHAIYASVHKACQVKGWTGVDALIIGGDFQAVRNALDLNTMSVPPKFRAIGDFHEYYSGARQAPYLTLFVGGNHEASSHLQELYYGGWVAPNIYYLGAANVVNLGGLRIAGLSGIWKGYNYNKPHFEKLPYTADEIKSLYHVRELDVRKLLLLRHQVHIAISHDWPRGIEWHGDHRALFRQKDLFEEDAKNGVLGSTAAKYVMDRLRPQYWFSAHLHCKFAATVDHAKEGLSNKSAAPSHDEAHDQPPATVINDEEIEIDLDSAEEEEGEQDAKSSNPAHVKNPQEESLTNGNSAKDNPHVEQDVPASNVANVSEDLRARLPASFQKSQASTAASPTPLPFPETITNTITKFLALDKCLPNRKFLQLLELDCDESHNNDIARVHALSYDPEWLAILRLFRAHDPHTPYPPDAGEASYMSELEEERAWIDRHVVETNRLAIPHNFTPTSHSYTGQDIRSIGHEQPIEYSNPQTVTFCELIDIPNHFDNSEPERQARREFKYAQISQESAAATAAAKATQNFRGARRGGRGRGRGNRFDRRGQRSR